MKKLYVLFAILIGFGLAMDSHGLTVISIDVEPGVKSGPFEATIEFNKGAPGFVKTHIILRGIPQTTVTELTPFDGTDDTYIATITPIEEGILEIDIEASFATGDFVEVEVYPPWMPDPNLRDAVRNNHDDLEEKELFKQADLLDLTELTAEDVDEIIDITGLEHATNLVTLDLKDHLIEDIYWLEDLAKLKTLDLSGNQIPDLRPLAALTLLEQLSINENFVITDLSPLAELRSLRVLSLKDNELTDVAPLMYLHENLGELYLTGNPIVDGYPLAVLTAEILEVDADVVIPGLIPDMGLADRILSTLELAADTDITVPILQTLTTLDAAALDIKDLRGLEWATNLETLNLSDNQILNIERLGATDNLGLAKLTDVNLSDNRIRDITPLENMTELTVLNLNQNSVRDISVLSGLTKVTRLALDNNKVSDLTPLVEMPALTDLSIAGNGIRNIDALDELRGLRRLNLANNSIRDPRTLTRLEALTDLSLADNQITDVKELVELKKLTRLDLSQNRIRNITPLGELTALTELFLADNRIDKLQVLTELTELRRLDLADNNVATLKPIAGLTELTALNLANNRIKDLTSLAALTQLTELYLSGNEIVTVTPLLAVKNVTPLPLDDRGIAGAQQAQQVQGLTLLEVLHLTDNEIRDVSPLANLANLRILRIAGNPITDLKPLVPLVQRTPPVDIDLPVSAYPAWDVNEDGKVDEKDVTLVREALGQKGDKIANPRTDVNGDDTVNNADLQLVQKNLDSTPDDSQANTNNRRGLRAPLEGLETLDREALLARLEALRLESDGSLKYREAIALIEALLAAQRPDATALLANYPNPFNPETWIPYTLANDSEVTIRIYDARGHLVRHLALGHTPAGYYTEKTRAAYWDGRNALGEQVGSGVYFYQLQTDGVSLLRKMLILK